MASAPGGVAINVPGALVYQQARAAGRIVRLGPRPGTLVGRDGLLGELVRHFADSPPAPRIRVLAGLGGVGKTSVAVEFAHRRAHVYGLVWQLNSGDPAALDGQIGQLAALLGVIGATGDLLGAVQARLAGMQERWLLVLDNVADPEVVARLMPAASAGDVVVTTQRTDWPAGWAMRVPVLDREVAIEFLLSHAHDGDVVAAGRVADALVLLPLALAQAAAFLRATGRATAVYLDLLSSERARVLKRVVPGGYGRAVAGAWSAAVEQMQDAPGAVGLLRLLSCYAPDAIPVRLLLPDYLELPAGIDAGVVGQLAALIGDRLALDEALIALGEYSLIGPVLGGAVSVHRLVQATTLDALDESARETWRDAAARLVARALPEDPELPRAWPIFAALLPHTETTLPPWHPGLLRVVQYLAFSGNYVAAREVARRAVDALTRRHGLENADTLAARHELAAWTGETGDAVGARDQFVALLPIRERACGSEHPDALISRHELARWTGEAGDVVGARDLFAALLPINERVRGAEDPITLIVRLNLAHWTGEAGDAAGARDLFTASLPIIERVRGREHPRTLSTRHQLAHWTGEAGDAAGARDQLAALLPVIERVRGAEHPETLISQHRLAHWTGEAGDVAGARDLFAALLPIIERVRGLEHPRTLSTRDQLAYWTGQAGDAAGARDQLAALLPVIERVCGPEHPDTLSTRHQLAHWSAQMVD